ncbi:MAG TPA: hypothetical protein VHS58_04465 [Acetobacteraceae bacterium]|jgi:hypothetical protein|nr:hypothetical protein [Acetobacteraceae bacterium]
MAPRSITEDPDLRLLVDGRIIRPQVRSGLIYRFEVAAVSEARIVSRSVIPAAMDPSMQDVRRLGIGLIALQFRSANLDIVVPADDPALTDGYYPPEDRHRWTNGRAAIPTALLACFPAGFSLEIHVTPPQLRYPLI